MGRVRPGLGAAESRLPTGEEYFARVQEEFPELVAKVQKFLHEAPADMTAQELVARVRELVAKGLEDGTGAVT